MRIAICDDEVEQIKIIEDYIKRLDIRDAECAAFNSGEDFLVEYDKNEKYDVIFLDMEMQCLNGIDTAIKIRETDERVIIVFVTSHTEYMQKSFECQPFRFLVKPIEFEEFKTVFRDIQKKLSKQRKIFAFTENKTKVRLFCDDIIYCESEAHFVLIHTKEQTYRVYKTLNEVHKALDKDILFRVHKSYIANFNYIKMINDNDIYLYNCDAKIPISRTRKKEVIREYTNFTERNLYV